MPALILAFYDGLIVAALIVAILSGKVLFQSHKKKTYDPVFYFSLAITIAWVGTASIRIWFRIWKDGKLNGIDTTWMLNHPFLIVLISILITGGILHVRTLTQEKTGEIGWILDLSAVVTTIVLSYLWHLQF